MVLIWRVGQGADRGIIETVHDLRQVLLELFLRDKAHRTHSFDCHEFALCIHVGIFEYTHKSLDDLREVYCKALSNGIGQVRYHACGQAAPHVISVLAADPVANKVHELTHIVVDLRSDSMDQAIKDKKATRGDSARLFKYEGDQLHRLFNGILGNVV